MAVRRESVELSLQDAGFTTGMARAAAATALLERELNKVDGNSIRANRSTKALANDGVGSTGTQARRASADLNQFTGRLNLLVTAAATLGPALLPIGAVAVPAVTALASGIGAAAGAVGTAMLAFHGLGDSLKALDAYQLEPTDANLKKLHDTLGQMSPAAQDFVMRLDELEPALKRLQNTAQRNMFPGLNEGLDSVMTLLPEVRQVVASLSREMGNLASDAGKSLADDPDWQAFFNYIKTDAAPTLDKFARATGNFVAGLGSILVAFQPLSDDFSSGLLEMSRNFREWAASMSGSSGFQDFVDYIRENGPAVGDFFAALAHAMVGLARAAAPWGATILPILTDAADVFATLANSPVGPVLYEAAAGMLLLSKASSLTSQNFAKFQTSWSGFAKSAAGAGGLLVLADSTERAGTAFGLLESAAGGAATGFAVGGPLGAGIGATAGGLLQMKSSVDSATDSISALNDAIDSHDRARLAESIDSAYQKLGDMGWLDKVLGSTDALKATIKSAETALEGLDAAGGHAGDAADLFGETIGLTGRKARIAAGDVTALSDAIGDLSGWLDKRSALRNYQQSLDDFTASLKKNGGAFDIHSSKGRANQQALDGIATSITQVANQIKDPGRKQNFITSAIGDLRTMASKDSPAAASAIHGVIRELKNLDATPAKPKLDVDTKKADRTIAGTKESLAAIHKTKVNPKIEVDRKPAQSAFGWLYGQVGKANRAHSKSNIDANIAPAQSQFRVLFGQLGKIDGKRVSPKIDADASAALAKINAVQARLNALRDRTIHITTVANKISAGSAGTKVGNHATGGFIAGPGTATSDSIPAWLSNGEYVIRAASVSKYGKQFFDGLNAQRFNRGGDVTQKELKTPLFTSEGPKYYKAAYKHNKPFAKDGPSHWDWPYQTVLSEKTSRAFEKWISDKNVPFNPGARIVDYDMRGYYKKTHGKGWHHGSHFPDTYKTPYDTTFSHESKYATKKNPFYWHGDKLIDERNGQVIFAATGGHILGTGTATSDSIPAWLSNGEYVIRANSVEKYGKALFDGLNAGKFANGGLASLTGPGVSGGKLGNPYAVAGQFGIDVDHDDKLKHRLDLFGKALDRAKESLDNEKQARDSLRSSISSGLSGDLFGASGGSAFGKATADGSVADVNARLRQQTLDARQFAALERQLRARGVRGAALEEVISSGDINRLRIFASASNAQLGQYQSLYGQRNVAVSAAANTGAGVMGMTTGINQTNNEIRVLTATVKQLQKQLDAQHRDSKKDRAKNSSAHTAALNGAASNGHKKRR